MIGSMTHNQLYHHQRIGVYIQRKLEHNKLHFV